MNAADLFVSVPPWLVLATALGIALGAAYKTLRPRGQPSLLWASYCWTVGLALGHLLALTSDLPGLQLGSLRLLPGLAIGLLLLLVAKRTRVC